MITSKFRIDMDDEHKQWIIREWGASEGNELPKFQSASTPDSPIARARAMYNLPKVQNTGFFSASIARARAMNNLPKGYELLFSHPAADCYRIEGIVGKD